MSNAMRQIGYGAVGIAFGLLGACAHEQPAPVAQTPPTPPTEVVVVRPQLEVIVEEKEDKIGEVLASTILYFDFDQSILKRESQEKLQNLAEALQKHRKVAIQIQGNCDERGTEEYNLHLGQRRAFAAQEYLVKLGVDTSRVDAISFGFEHPVDPRHNEEAWAKNRRDDFVRAEKVSER